MPERAVAVRMEVLLDRTRPMLQQRPQEETTAWGPVVERQAHRATVATARAAVAVVEHTAQTTMAGLRLPRRYGPRPRIAPRQVRVAVVVGLQRERQDLAAQEVFTAAVVVAAASTAALEVLGLRESSCLFIRQQRAEILNWV